MGRDDGVVWVRDEVTIAEESEGFVAEEVMDFTPDLWGDGGVTSVILVIVKEEWDVFMRERKAEGGGK